MTITDIDKQLNYDKENIWHVTPINDIKEHLESMECWCNPKVEIQDNGGVVVTHNSLDGREMHEPDNKIVIN